jgi:hypothetical protein
LRWGYCTGSRPSAVIGGSGRRGGLRFTGAMFDTRKISGTVVCTELRCVSV